MATLSREEKPLRIFPNPVVDQLTITVNPTCNTDLIIQKITVSDLLGRTRPIKSEGLSFPIFINLTGLEEGLYFLQVLFEDNTASTLKFIKTN
jgi:hypothetical protein